MAKYLVRILTENWSGEVEGNREKCFIRYISRRNWCYHVAEHLSFQLLSNVQNQYFPSENTSNTPHLLRLFFVRHTYVFSNVKIHHPPHRTTVNPTVDQQVVQPARSINHKFWVGDSNITISRISSTLEVQTTYSIFKGLYFKDSAFTQIVLSSFHHRQNITSFQYFVKSL